MSSLFVTFLGAHSLRQRTSGEVLDPHFLNSVAAEVSTETPDTDECVFGAGSLQLLSSIRSEPNSTDLGMEKVSGLNARPVLFSGSIRRTLLSVLKLPKALGRSSTRPIPSLDSDSQMTSSVVLTKLDGGGSYHSTVNGDNDLQASLTVFPPLTNFPRNHRSTAPPDVPTRGHI
jgi:hypothetical protein